MEFVELWEKIIPIENSLIQIKKDLQEGRVPELPFYIVDLKDEKARIGDYLYQIDIAFQSCLLIAGYGNGKTNLLKYLKLFFIENKKYNIDVHYTRADVEQYDIVLSLLKILQDSYLDDLIRSINSIKEENYQLELLCNNFNDSFGSIKEYAHKLYDIDDEELLKKVIYLGTGRLYSKGSFKEFDLEQLTNFNRREVLVLFLNILAHCKMFKIFAIDEVEKIQEKSKVRFNYFLTSYRELIDLSPFINGHLIFTSFTDSSGNSSQSLNEINPAFFRRIENRIIELPIINANSDLIELATHLNEILNSGKSNEEINKISALKRDFFSKNSDIVKYFCTKLLEKNENKPLNEMLSEATLTSLYENTKNMLENEDTFIRINQRFFDPLEEYLIANNVHYTLYRQKHQAFFDKDLKILNVFLFTDDIISNTNRLVNANEDEEIPSGKLVIYCPNQLELSYSNLNSFNLGNFELVYYDPKELMTLLVIYRDENLEFGAKIKDIISNYTNQNL